MRNSLVLPAFLVSTLAFSMPPASAEPLVAEPAGRLDDRGAALFRSPTLPRRSYAWNTWLIGDDDTHVIVTEGELGDRPANYRAVDNQGKVLWTADHVCPDFDSFTTIFALEGGPGRIICKWNKQIVAVDMKTGKEAWRFADPKPMYITAGAQNRVAVSIANKELAVLDASDGRELMRFDVEGAVLEAVAATKQGPLALLVWDDQTRQKDTIELAVGDGGALERIELSGDDPLRKLVGLEIGGPAKKALLPMKPRWMTPFEGYSFEVSPTGGAVVGVPRENTRAAWDITNGKLLWERPFVDGELMIFGDDGAAFARPDASGNYVWGALDPKTLQAAWEKPLPAGEKPTMGGQGGGDLGLVTSNAFRLVRYSDGKERVTIPLEAGLELASIRSTKRSLLWVTQRDTERWVHFKALPPL